LLRIQMAQSSGAGGDWDELHADIFGEDYLLARPLLRAIQRQGPTVLLVDETDKADVEVEGLLLEVLGDFQVTIPELGTITAVNRPFVVLTSNATRELSEALRRRCLYAHVGYPDAERERAIVLARVPEASEQLAAHVVRAVRALRGMGLRKPPSIAESIDWARTVLALGLDTLDDATAAATLGVVVKHDGDHGRAVEALGLGARR
jgi:MoxR-like ATPase